MNEDQTKKEVKGPAWLWSQLESICDLDPERRLVTCFTADASHVLTRGRFRELVLSLSVWLDKAGVDDGDYVGIDASMRVESLVMWFACIHLGAVAVLYPADMPPEAMQRDAAERRISVVLTEDPGGAKRWFTASAGECRKLRHILYIDSRSSEGPSIDNILGWPLPEKLTSFESCSMRYQPKDSAPCRVRPSEPCAVVFSQGTTAGERPVTLSYRGLAGQAEALRNAFGIADLDRILYTPSLIHVDSAALFCACLASGASFVFASRSEQNILDIIAQTLPHHIFAHPRLIHQIALQILAHPVGNSVHKGWNRFCVIAGKFRRKSGPRLRALSGKLIDSVFLRHLKNRLGPECRDVISLGASIDTHDADTLSCLDIPVYNAYTAVEGGGYAHIHRFNETGGFLPACDASIRRGMLYLRPHDCGDFMPTGDYAFEDDRNGLCVRRISAITLDSGQTIDTTALHDTLVCESLIEQILIFGQNRPCLTALVYLDEAALRQWAGEQKLDATKPFATLAQHPRVYEYIQRRIAECGSIRAQNEDIRKFAIIPTPLHDDARILTESGLVRTYEAEHKYAGILNSFYTDAF